MATLHSLSPHLPARPVQCSRQLAAVLTAQVLVLVPPLPCGALPLAGWPPGAGAGRQARLSDRSSSQRLSKGRDRSSRPRQGRRQLLACQGAAPGLRRLCGRTKALHLQASRRSLLDNPLVLFEPLFWIPLIQPLISISAVAMTPTLVRGDNRISAPLSPPGPVPV